MYFYHHILTVKGTLRMFLLPVSVVYNWLCKLKTTLVVQFTNWRHTLDTQEMLLQAVSIQEDLFFYGGFGCKRYRSKNWHSMLI